jgi:hypothetical protein
MLRVKSGTTDQRVYFVAPAGASGFAVRRKRGTNASAPMTISGSDVEVDPSIPTLFSLLMDEDMTITAGKLTEIMAFYITGAGMQAQTVQVELIADQIGSGGASLNAVPWNAAWDAEVQSEVNDGLVAYDPPTDAELTAAINAVLAAIAALNDLSEAEVNTQVLDVLATDTFGEPAGVPGATTTLATKLGYLFMALRNGISVTATKKQFLDDGGAAEWEKDLSDDGTTYTESEANAP